MTDINCLHTKKLPEKILGYRFESQFEWVTQELSTENVL